MEAVLAWLANLYEHFPAWLSILAMLCAAVGFVADYVVSTRLGRVKSYPPIALAVVVALLSIALFYVWVAVAPDVSVTARAGASRIIFFLLAVSLTMYNGGMIELMVREVMGGKH